MKLGSLKSDSRDGVLVVVSKDNKKVIKATGIAETLQFALDNWEQCEPKLKALSDSLNNSSLEGEFDYNLNDFHSPLPRAYTWMDGSAFIQHVKLDNHNLF